MDEIIALIRSMTQESAITDKDIFVYEGKDVFKLSDENTQAVSTVYINDVALAESGNWSYDSTTNRITFLSGVGLNVDDVIEINFTTYPNYSDSELKDFIKNAIIHIAANAYTAFEVDSAERVQPEPSLREQYLIAMIANILINPDNRTIRIPDLTIEVPRTTSIPVEDMISKAVAIFKKNTHGIFSLMDTRWQFRYGRGHGKGYFRV